MKKVFFFVLLLTVTWSTYLVNGNMEEKRINPGSPQPKESKISDQEVKKMTDRLKEIRQMDRSKLSAEQKRGLRKEVRGIKKKMDGGYIYISGSALLIILLLILLL